MYKRIANGVERKNLNVHSSNVHGRPLEFLPLLQLLLVSGRGRGVLDVAREQVFAEEDEVADEDEEDDLDEGDADDVGCEPGALFLGIEEGVHCVSYQGPIRGESGGGTFTVDVLAGTGDIGYAEITGEDEHDEGEVKPGSGSDVGTKDLEEGKDGVEDVLGDVGEGCPKARQREDSNPGRCGSQEYAVLNVFLSAKRAQ